MDKIKNKFKRIIINYNNNTLVNDKLKVFDELVEFSTNEGSVLLETAKYSDILNNIAKDLYYTKNISSEKYIDVLKKITIYF